MPITGTGFAQAIIKNIGLIAKENDPQLKVTPTGFLKLLLENNALVEINNIEELRKGQKRTIKLRYLQRGSESEVTDVDNCDTNTVDGWKESEIPTPQFSKIGIFIPDDEFRQYEEEAIQTLALGDSQQAPLMRGFYEILLTKLIGLISKIDTNLIAAQALKWGENAAYSPRTGAKVIELGKTADFNSGYVKLQEDALINELNGDLLLCGNGLITRYDMYHRLKAGNDANGIGALPLNAYYDPRTKAGWGTDHFGVFAKGTIGFVDWNKNVGPYAGEKGGHIFFTLPIPVELAGGILSSLVLDAQMFYGACPEYDGDGVLTKDRGWNIILSKHYGLFNLPDNAFASSDILYKVNGSLHYVAQEKAEVTSVAPTADAVFKTQEVTEEP